MTEMTMKKVVLTLCILAVSLPTAAAEQAALSVSERYSYAMGVRLGQLLKGQGIRQLDSKAFAAAIDDVLLNRPLRLDDNEMVAAIREQQRVFANQREQRAQTNLVAGREFLAKTPVMQMSWSCPAACSIACSIAGPARSRVPETVSGCIITEPCSTAPFSTARSIAASR